MKLFRTLFLVSVACGCGGGNHAGPDDGGTDLGAPDADSLGPSIARQWDEAILRGIRRDFPRPTVHARNLYHLSAAMYDAWCAYDASCDGVFVREKVSATDVDAARREAISYAAYRVLYARYSGANGGATTAQELDDFLTSLGYDKTNTGAGGNTPSELGNRIAATILAAGLTDGSRESENYFDSTYVPVNAPLIVKLPGTVMVDPNRWQPLSLDYMVSQNGIPIPASVQTNVTPHWNEVTSFALTRANPTDLYIDPGPPPAVGSTELLNQAVEVIAYTNQIDANDPTTIDISPGVRGNDAVASDSGTGHGVNPVTGQPYAPNVVRRTDFVRATAEFWADGPTSETPPGHWNVIANQVSDTPGFVHRIGGVGPELNRLEWDVKMYLAMNGAVHDAAILAWGLKGHYDSSRPISLIRYFGGLGQSSDPTGTSYDPNGLPLIPGVIEVITAASSAPGERHEALAAFVGEVALYVWPGPPAVPATETSPRQWIRAVNWTPYQRKTFVTPAFPGYISGHSTFSRAGAEVMVALTGSMYFPGGLYVHDVAADSFVHEDGPPAAFSIGWATYYDASDDAGRSRLMGGIHIRADDWTGRRMGQQAGLFAWSKATRYFNGTAVP